MFPASLMMKPIFNCFSQSLEVERSNSEYLTVLQLPGSVINDLDPDGIS